jgi:hypothetical protein
VCRLLVTVSVFPSSPILVNLMKRRLLQDPHGVTFQKNPFFSSELNLFAVGSDQAWCHENCAEAADFTRFGVETATPVRGISLQNEPHDRTVLSNFRNYILYLIRTVCKI